MAGAVVLEARGLTRHFTGVLALSRVDLRLRAGEVHALMGQNGAGKSTLIKVLTGVHPPDGGELLLNGVPVHPGSPAAAQRLGISTVYQEVNLCANLSVAENIFAGRYPRKGAAGGWGIDWRRMQAEARTLLARLNLDIDVTQLLSSYPVAVQQLVAIARALGVDAKVLILDEPTSSLDEQEVERLFTVLRQLRDEGLAILFVTHFFDQMYAISDRITVLRNGELVGEYLKADLPPAALITAMVGRELSEAAGRNHPASAAAGPVLLQATGLGRRGHLNPVDLALKRGEVVGVGGLLGSGRTELARLLFGLDRCDSGTLQIDGQPVRFDNPAQAIRHGLGLCPEERKHDGIVAELSVRENIALALQARLGLWKFLSQARQREIAERFVQALGIKTASIETPIALLSGGNQQKAVLARWLATEPRLLILDEPTRGIDVAAKQEIMNQILALARDGLAVLFISSEMDEVVRVSDRIVVLRDRSKVGELPGDSSEQAVYHLIAARA
ncbi:MAG: sugar ABC transporter ATP-binding protein [Rubrivivax sp.]|nr:sugar ABC transporter ATP-binding protein [Rubrivivax sp.]